MPKSKVRKKTAYTPPSNISRTPVKVAGPTHPVYVAVMLGLMLLGLAWLVVNYLAGDKIGFMIALNAWNFVIGFALIVVGLLMTMRWR
jgi:Cell division protein CrgA